jgi:hypothetical protein
MFRYESLPEEDLALFQSPIPLTKLDQKYSCQNVGPVANLIQTQGF